VEYKHIIIMKSSIISTKEITNILNQFGYKPNPVMFQITGEHVWMPMNEPMDLDLPKKTIRMSELVKIKTSVQLKKLINIKLGK
jgi:hypothetical protein